MRYGKSVSSSASIRLGVNCDLFLMTTSGCIKHIATQKFLEVRDSDDYISLGSSTCVAKTKGFKKDSYSVISKDGKYVSPRDRQLVPGIDRNLKTFGVSSVADVQVRQFYFRQGKVCNKFMLENRVHHATC